MANEAREAAIKTAIQKFKDENLENPNSALPTDIRVILTDGIRLGYDAHESAIRTAAAALVDVLEADLFTYGSSMVQCRELDALKAALAKEKE